MDRVCERRLFAEVAMVCLAVLGAVAAWGGEAAGGKDETPPPVAEQIKRLVPEASSMSIAELARVASMGGTPAKLENQSLTAVLLWRRPEDAGGPKRHLRLLKGRPKPTALLGEAYRRVRLAAMQIPAVPYVTVIHADRITGCTCRVDGDAATGTVTFRAPELYEGEVDYLARKKGEAWQIVEFRLPDCGIRVVRTAKGSWKKEPWKPAAK